MKAKLSRPPTGHPRKKSDPVTRADALEIAALVLARAHRKVCDTVGKLRAEISHVESLAASATALDSDDPQSRRRLWDLAVKIGAAAGEAWRTAIKLDARVNPRSGS